MRAVAIAGALFAAALAAILALPAVYGQAKLRSLSAPPDRRYLSDNRGLAARDGGVGLLIIGDSRAARWLPPPPLSLGTPVNRGVPGETSVQTAARFAEDALALRPRCILVVTGINDLVAASYLGHAERAVVVQNLLSRLSDMARDAKAAGITMSIATIIPPARPDWLRWLVWRSGIEADVRAVNTHLRTNPAIPVFDAAALLVAEGATALPEQWRSDTLHLNAKAYNRLNDAIVLTGSVCP